MKYVSDSARQRKNKEQIKRAVKPSRSVFHAQENETAQTEKDGVTVDVKTAIPPKYLIRRQEKKADTGALVIRILIGAAIALSIAVVMALVYWFATRNVEQKQEIKPPGFPVLVAGNMVSEAPTKVVSLSPLLTDMVNSFPLGQPLTAVSEYCDNEGVSLPTVGTALLPDIEAIVEINAQYLITLTPLTRQQKTRLEQVGTRCLEFSSPTSQSELTELAAELCSMYLGKDDGRAVATDIYDRFFNSLTDYKQRIGDTKTFALLYDLSGISATPDTLEAKIFSSIFSAPAADGIGYVTTIEQIINANPAVIILPESYTLEDIVAAGLGESAAVINNMCFFINYGKIETYSPQLLFTLAEIAAQVYPELQLDDI